MSFPFKVRDYVWTDYCEFDSEVDALVHRYTQLIKYYTNKLNNTQIN
jgi:hypothetical protein